jgi:hypothetical protein
MEQGKETNLKSVVKEGVNRKELQQLIIQLTEQKVDYKFSDQNLDRELEKHKLLNGKEFSIKEVRDCIRNKARSYSPMFPIAYWREMFRLFGWPEQEASRYHKKREAAMFNREVIYGRFDKGVLLSLHVLNPYTGYMTRTYKHFQFLTDEGIEKLATVINEAIEMMGQSSTYYDFRENWYKVYGVPYQMNFFKEHNS